MSEAVQTHPSPALIDWLGAQPDEALYISTLTLAEIRRGILQKEPGRRRRELETWFASGQGPQALFAGRILSFDECAALEWGRLMAEGTAAGRPRGAIDMLLAATAVAHRLTVATVNERHFHELGVPWFNPQVGSGSH